MGAPGHHGPIIAVGGSRATVCRTASSVRLRHMNDILVLPTGALADASLAIARSSVNRSIVDHSIRSFLFARLLAEEEGSLHDADYDEDLLFAATVMHDLGLGARGPGAVPGPGPRLRIGGRGRGGRALPAQPGHPQLPRPPARPAPGPGDLGQGHPAVGPRGSPVARGPPAGRAPHPPVAHRRGHLLQLGREHATGEARFEVEGADMAAQVLRKHAVNEADVDRVWEAIALHSSLGIAHRRGLLTDLTHKGVFIDAGRITDAIADRLRHEVLNVYPRPAGDRSIADAIIAHAKRSEAAAPPGSLAFELRQHREAENARRRS